MTIFDEDRLAQDFYRALGGASSPLRQPIKAQLGHPATYEVLLPSDSRQYVGQVWLHDLVGDFPAPDTDEEGPREDVSGGAFTGWVPRELRTEDFLTYGNTVDIVWDGARWKVTGITPQGDDYLGGRSDGVAAGIERHQFNWNLIRPNAPADMTVVLSGGVVVLDGVAYDLAALVTENLSSYQTGLVGGQARALLITRDPVAGTYTIDDGDPFTDNRDAATGIRDHLALFGSYPVTIPNDELLWGWVVVYSGQAQIVAEDILPALDTGKGVLGGSVTSFPDLLDVDENATPDENFVPVGDGTKYVTRLLNLPDLGDVADEATPTFRHFLVGGEGSGPWISRAIQLADLPTINPATGGTGLTSYTAGDLIYATGPATLEKLSIGAAATGDVLTKSAGGLPVWAAPSSGGGGGGDNEYWQVRDETGLVLTGSVQYFSDFDFQQDSAGFDNQSDTDRIEVPTDMAGRYYISYTVSIAVDDDNGVGENLIGVSVQRNGLTNEAMLRGADWVDATNFVRGTKQIHGHAVLALSDEDYLRIGVVISQGVDTGSGAVEAYLRSFAGIKLS